MIRFRRSQWTKILLIAAALLWAPLLRAQPALRVKNSEGVQLVVDDDGTQPVLRIVVPGVPDSEHAIFVLFPEHVTVRKHGETDSEQLYIYRPGNEQKPPDWRQIGQSFQYEKDFPPGIHFLARATLEEDGVLFHYEFANHSDIAYDMATAITDPRLMSIFQDLRLERTYVHQLDGFELLASETPARLTMPLKDWLPSRYMDSYTWPVPAHLVEHRSDGITYYNKARPADEPLLATLSQDYKWVVASFTRSTGNVWSNPELTCQHVDQDTPLPAGGHGVIEVKVLVFQGSLPQVQQKVVKQRNHLQ